VIFVPFVQNSNPENESRPMARPAKAPFNGPEPMTETMTQHRPPTRAKRDRARLVPDDVVSPNGLATHLGMTRQNVARLTSEAVLVQRGDGRYDQTRNRLRYIKHLREGFRHSPRTEADSELAKARAKWLRLRSAERMKDLVPAEIYQQAIDELAGATLTAMASIPARLFPYASGLAERRRCEGIIRQVRQELAAKALRRAGSLREIDGEGQERSKLG
jgi:hypothetical protein